MSRKKCTYFNNNENKLAMVLNTYKINENNYEVM